MIIDCHGHYTTAPAAHTAWREQQIAAWQAGTTPPAYPSISDDEIRETIETSQLRLMDERGIDVTLFSPRASAMAHHVGDAAVSLEWSRRCNDLVHRVTTLFPDRFVGVSQLPQSPGADIRGSVDELRRCVEELGFVGCNLNPDPSGGHWTSPALTDRSWYPFYEAMVELDVPAMVHVSASATPVFHATGAYYINADTTAFMQLLQGTLFADLPELRLVIPHGGERCPTTGAGTGDWPTCSGSPCRGHRHGQRLLRHLRLPPAGHRPAARRHRHRERPLRLRDGGCGARHRPAHRSPLRRHPPLRGSRVREGALDEERRAAVFEGNVRRVYPRLDALLTAGAR
ncbi:amidohydrolase family protein [Blastococcus brunescens]|uniref:amidohydrolase family protein n=1 Tax=Blastococcus brunescens TaxID=1564165 RepID=UPI003BEEBCAD